MVLDSSVALSWCFPDEADPYALAVVDGLDVNCTAVVPDIWRLEVANALLMAERRGRTTDSDTARFLIDLQILPISVDEEGFSHAFTEVIPLARRHGITSYDASYVELCARMGLPLASVDARLNDAATIAGVQLYSP